MAHSCPVCGCICHCNGDWDDVLLELEEDIDRCICCVDYDENFDRDGPEYYDEESERNHE